MRHRYIDETHHTVQRNSTGRAVILLIELFLHRHCSLQQLFTAMFPQEPVVYRINGEVIHPVLKIGRPDIGE